MLYYVHTQIPPVSRVSQKHKYSFPSQRDVQNHRRLAERKTELNETVGSTQVSLVYALDQGSPSSVLEGRCPAEFSSNPNQTHLKQLIKVLLGILETSMQVC